MLLLDEPTNDLDVDTLRALEEALEDFAGCAVIISHDRWFLDRIATHILAFEARNHVEWFEGNFQDYEQDKMRRSWGSSSVMPLSGSNIRNSHALIGANFFCFACKLPVSGPFLLFSRPAGTHFHSRFPIPICGGSAR